MPAITVDSLTDDGTGGITLREAIEMTNNGDDTSIIFDASIANGTILLASDLPEIVLPVLINGGTQNITIDGNSKAIDYGFQIGAAGAGTTIQFLTIQNFGIYGIAVNSSDDNNIFGNRILDNGGAGDNGGGGGILIDDGAGNQIGSGTLANANVIGNTDAVGAMEGAGIVIGAGSGNSVLRNFIGVDSNETTNLGNDFEGILIQNSSSNTITGNVIGFNGKDSFGYGISIFAFEDGAAGVASSNVVTGNFIGVNTIGGNIGNVLSGVQIDVDGATGVFGASATNNQIGDGTLAGANTIANNGTDANDAGVILEFTGTGTTVNDLIGNSILTNSIFNNSGAGIDQTDGIIQAAPTLTGMTYRTGNQSLVVEGTMGVANTTFRFQVFKNTGALATAEGETFLGEAVVTTDALGNFAVELLGVTLTDNVDDRITVTATAANDSTSPFSAREAVFETPPPPPNAPSTQTSVSAGRVFSVVGATGSPTSILSVKIFDGDGNLVSTVQPFDNPSSLRVAVGDFDGDGIYDEFAVLGRRTNSDLRAEIITYDLSADGQPTETGRFDGFPAEILGNGFITAGDFNGDGFDDIAVAQIGGGRVVASVQIHVNDGNGNFTMGGFTTLDFGVISAPRIGAGDTDGDGFDEIVVSARTPGGADVRVLDAENPNVTPTVQGTFIWTFGIEGYGRGAFVAVGEFDPNFVGEEIVLGSNVGGGGRLDIVSFDGTTATLVENGRTTPFGDTFNAAVRVAVGQVGDTIGRPVILAGQDRFQNGETVFLARQYNFVPSPQAANPAFQLSASTVVLTDADGLGPDTSATGDRTLGPFVAFANTGLVYARGRDTGTVSGGAVGRFDISQPFAVPAGATFNNANNRLFVDVGLTGGNLSDVDVFLAAFNGNTLLQQQQLIFDTMNPAATRIDVQFGDGLAQVATPVGGVLTGFFAPVQSVDAFFTGGNVTNPNVTWALVIDNNTGSTVTLLDWELTMAFDV